MGLLTSPLKDIKGSLGKELEGRKVALCITGSVAASQSPEVARALMRHGAEVLVVMSRAAQRIIHPDLMEWATGNPVVTRLTGRTEHIWLAGAWEGRVDLVLVAPCTANTISKMACGIDDTPVTTVASTALGSGIPILVAPAMHESLYRHPIVLRHIEALKGLGVEFVGPRLEEGKAKVATPRDILEAVIWRFTTRDMEGLKVLVTAGPTVEHIDPIRIITNRSSGKMGVALCQEARRRGAEVALIYGPGTAEPPQSVRVVRVETGKTMLEAVQRELASSFYDIVVAAAAVADLRPEGPFEEKVSTRGLDHITLKLVPTPKVIQAVKAISPKTFLVAFKAEYGVSDGEMVQRSQEFIAESKVDLVAVNDVSRQGVGFMVDTNEVLIVDGQGRVVHVSLCSKAEVARRVLDVALERLGRRTIEGSG